MYGLISRVICAGGKRDELTGILVEAVSELPGCSSYVVARDAGDPKAIWITEVWDSRESHAASLSLPAVRQAMERGRPLIERFLERFETEPVGGHGVPDEPA